MRKAAGRWSKRIENRNLKRKVKQEIESPWRSFPNRDI